MHPNEDRAEKMASDVSQLRLEFLSLNKGSQGEVGMGSGLRRDHRFTGSEGMWDQSASVRISRGSREGPGDLI